mmetsp:Transcript_90728/g.282627  ORF Transcript_90728/g.282627 Transcript_90728/m.282627 type:complete len:232 (-) Transcript_90728:520-1215(-)
MCSGGRAEREVGGDLPAELPHEPPEGHDLLPQGALRAQGVLRRRQGPVPRHAEGARLVHHRGARAGRGEARQGPRGPLVERHLHRPVRTARGRGARRGAARAHRRRRRGGQGGRRRADAGRGRGEEAGQRGEEGQEEAQEDRPRRQGLGLPRTPGAGGGEAEGPGGDDDRRDARDRGDEREEERPGGLHPHNAQPRRGRRQVQRLHQGSGSFRVCRPARQSRGLAVRPPRR